MNLLGGYNRASLFGKPPASVAITAPTAAWNLNEATGNTRVDQVTSPTACDLSEQTPTRLQGIAGLISNGVRNFGNGLSTYTASVRNTTPGTKMNPGSGTWSASLWVKYANLGSTTYPISWADSNPSAGWFVKIGIGGVQVWSGQDNKTATAVTITASPPTLGVWYNIIVWYDGTKLYGCINNGTPVSANSAAPVNNSNQFSVSGHFGSVQTGLTDLIVDGVQWWKAYVLTGTERTLIYNGGAGRSYTVAGGFA